MIKQYRPKKIIRAARFTYPNDGEAYVLDDNMQLEKETGKVFLNGTEVRDGDYIIYSDNYSYATYGPNFEAHYVEVEDESENVSEDPLSVATRFSREYVTYGGVVTQ